MEPCHSRVTGAVRTTLQAIVRLLLGVVLLPLIWFAFLLFCLAAAFSDKQLTAFAPGVSEMK